jgi:signal transduction histidine kinase
VVQLVATAPGSASSRSLPWQRLAVCGLFALALQCLTGFIFFALYSVQPQGPGITSALAQELPDATLAGVEQRAWQKVELPNKFCSASCSSRYKAYRFELPTPQSSAGQALYVRTADGAFAAYLNGARIGQTGSMAEPIADLTYQPAYFDIPESLWNKQGNQLDIIVASLVPAGGRLTPPYVDASGPLKTAYRVAHGLTVDSLAIINGILLMFLFAAILLYFASNRAQLFIWFSLVLVFCMLRNMNILLPEWPASTLMRNAIYLSATLGVLLSAGGFISRLAATDSTRLDLVLMLAWVPATAAFAVGMHVDMWGAWGVGVTVIRLLTLTLGAWLLMRFLLYSTRLPVVVQASIFALLGAALTLMLHDTYGSSKSRLLMFQLSNLASLPLILSFCIALAHRYRAYLSRINNQNRLLKVAVAQKEAELASSYSQLSAARDAQVLADERQRIMQDMHDGVGGRLATMLQRLRREPASDPLLASELHTSLNDLRLIIDSLDNTTSGDLAFALGTFRERVEPWLNENHVELIWQVSLQRVIRLGPERTLQIYRILQESLNNVVRHSGARGVSVDVGERDGQLCVTVADNGCGLPDTLEPGRGLEIMRRRAQAMQGKIEFSSATSGLTICLTLPLATP